MANRQAFKMIDGYMRQIEQNTRALAWLEESRKQYAGDTPPKAISIDSMNQWGRGTEGFTEAAFLLNDYMRANQVAMIDAAISAARGHIRVATAQIKEWSEKL